MPSGHITEGHLSQLPPTLIFQILIPESQSEALDRPSAEKQAVHLKWGVSLRKPETWLDPFLTSLHT